MEIIALIILVWFFYYFGKKYKSKDIKNSHTNKRNWYDYLPEQPNTENKPLHSKKKTEKKSLKELYWDYSYLPAQAVILDLETTGLSKHRDDIIEIGMIKTTFFHDKNDDVCYENLVKPLYCSHVESNLVTGVRTNHWVTPFIQELTGISSKMIDDKGIALEQALKDVQDFVGDLPIIAHNAKFDMGFLQTKARNLGMTDFLKNNEVICTLELARQAMPKRKSYKLKDLVSKKQTHRALGDCKLVMLLYVRCMQEIEKNK